MISKYAFLGRFKILKTAIQALRKANISFVFFYQIINLAENILKNTSASFIVCTCFMT
ncbi:hypothetical protein D7V21_12265 [Acinetobacter guerrae]|uniref:Uncharacterized protein n=1 Tax=Acinetobacter guerrae TaxID=1843371 RepID=A0A3A8EDG7_9GAMM|nr:hypothetical protein D7V21_12265 [Acinetobacter guerrae]